MSFTGERPMGELLPYRSRTLVRADPKKTEPVPEDLSDDDIDARRAELYRHLDEDEDTPFSDPWPDHLNK